MFAIDFRPEAVKDLASLRKFDQQQIIHIIEAQLPSQATEESRNRKRLRPNQLAEWELRIGDFRVFYDLHSETAAVIILAIWTKARQQAVCSWKGVPAMKTITVSPQEADVNALLAEARQEDILVRAADGAGFMLTAVDDFDEELARTRRNAELMARVEERAKQTTTVPLDAVKRQLGLSG